MPYPYPSSNFNPTTNGISGYPQSTAPTGYSYTTPVQQPNLYQPPQAPQTYLPPLRAKMISSIDEVSAQDVPMDGFGAIFLTSDRNAVYTKNWAPDGTIKTERYIREQVEERPSPEASYDQTNLSDITNELSDIKERLSRLEQSNADRKRAQQQKREMRSDDSKS